MIDQELYKCRVGIFNGQLYSRKVKTNRYNEGETGNCMAGNCSVANFLSVSVIYIYFMLCVLGVVMGMAIECKLSTLKGYKFYYLTDMEMMHLHLTHVKILSTVLLAFLITRDCIIFSYFGYFIGFLSKLNFNGHHTDLGLAQRGNSSRLKNAVTFFRNY